MQAFYSTCAQVIPVLLLTLTLGEEFLLAEVVTDTARPLFGKPKKLSARYRSNVMFGAVAIMFVAEFFALAALINDDPTDLQTAVFKVVCLLGVSVGLIGVLTVIYLRLRRSVGLPER